MTTHPNSDNTTPPDAKKHRSAHMANYKSFAPIAFIIVITLLAMVVFQTIQVNNERKILKNVKISQEGSIQESKKLRAQLDSIASKTARLAIQGNPNAKIIIEELRKRGITVNPKNTASN